MPIGSPFSNVKTYVLDGTTSYDTSLNGTIVSYEWSLAGKVVGHGPTLQIPLRVGRTYTFMLKVTDSSGLTDMTIIVVKPTNGALRPVVVSFHFDQYSLAVPVAQRLDRIARIFKKLGVKHITVFGYTDSAGTAKYDLRLSRLRAETVGEFLESKIGLAGRAVVEKGLGKTHFVAHNEINGRDNPAGRARNRRVVVTAYVS